MGIYSTIDITREDAISLIMKGIEESSDDELADALFDLYGNKTLNNYFIVSSYEESEQISCFD